MIVGTAGHVDHGKTSLVRALTGVDTDRLAEEKARGITIELGFAYARLGECGESCEAGDSRISTANPSAREPVGFVDVPGHRRFVQTMIAGAAGIDVGLLVVAADDGPMPQTREHLDILQWLGVPKLIVALSKVDRVDGARIDASADAVATLLDGTPYRGSPIVPVSSIDGTGLEILTTTLNTALVAALAVRCDATRAAALHGAGEAGGCFRLAIDRAFVLQGIGLVVTGTCISGRVAIDDRLTLLPGGLEARVRGIHAQNRKVDSAHAGQRVALNVTGRGVEKGAVHRGHWIVAPDLAIESMRIDVRLTVRPDAPDEAPGADASGAAPTPASIRFDARGWRHVRFHAGASSCNARVTWLDPSRPHDGGALAQIVFEHPVHVLAGDRFVLRDASAVDGASGSVAGGIVLDVDVPARGRRSSERLDFLDVAARGDASQTLVAAVGMAGRGVDLARWNATHNTSFGAGAVAARAVPDGRPGGLTLFSATRWDAMTARVLDVLATEHERAPDTVGPGRDRLRRMAVPSLDATPFGALVDGLKAERRLAQTGAWLHLPTHRIELSAVDRTRMERALPLLVNAPEPSNPPRVRDVARALGDDEAAIRSLFVRLASQGALYRVAHDHYFLPAIVRELARVVAEVAATEGVARAAPFRDRIGVGRKVAIQILEFYDRVGYTRRIGDDHRVIQPTLFDE